MPKCKHCGKPLGGFSDGRGERGHYRCGCMASILRYVGGLDGGALRALLDAISLDEDKHEYYRASEFFSLMFRSPQFEDGWRDKLKVLALEKLEVWRQRTGILTRRKHE